MSSSDFVFEVIKEYTKDNILVLLKNIEDLLDKESNLIRVPKRAKTMVVGDLHGDIETLEKIITLFLDENYKRLIFLGDYVDRGHNQVEVVNVLFYYKRIYPEKIILLRGNHEDPIINRQYGFYDEIALKFRDTHRTIFQRYNKVFSKLPIAAMTWNNIFCVHGGVPEGLDIIEEINDLPINQEEINCPITKQLIWNDPKEKDWEFRKSVRGPDVRKFGKDAFLEFIERNHIKYVIRSHERVKSGVKTFFDDKLISIFTTKTYSKRSKTVVGQINPEGEVKVLEI